MNMQISAVSLVETALVTTRFSLPRKESYKTRAYSQVAIEKFMSALKAK